MGYRDCHKGPVLVIAKDGLEIYGASATETEDNYKDYDLIISLAFLNVKPVVEKGFLSSIGLARLREKYNPEILSLNWPDMGIPQLDKGFWRDLVKVLKKKGRDRSRFKEGKGVYKVVVHCFGGHGRTGTCLAILGNFIDNEVWKGDLVYKVREKHCQRAIETDGQVKYIERITGEKQSEKGTKAHSNSNIQFSSGKSKGLPSTVNYGSATKCTYCQVDFGTIAKAEECEKEHRRVREEKNKAKIEAKIAKFEGTEEFSKEDLEASKKNVEDYFKRRESWRKDYKS